MAFNGNAEHVTRLTFLRAANVYMRVYFPPRVHGCALLSSAGGRLFAKGQPVGSNPRSLGVNTWGLDVSIVEFSGALSSAFSLGRTDISRRARKPQITATFSVRPIKRAGKYSRLTTFNRGCTARPRAVEADISDGVRSVFNGIYPYTLPARARSRLKAFPALFT